MEPRIPTITVTIKNESVIESLYNICQVIAKRMNKMYLNLMFIKNSNNNYDLCVTSETTPEEIENENVKSAQYMIANDPSIMDIDPRYISGSKVICVDAMNFYIFIKSKKNFSQKQDSKNNLSRS